MLSRNRRALRRAGFTLMEVLVVVAILVVLAGTGGVVYMKYLDDAKKDIARLNVQDVDAAVQTYKMRFGEYPNDLVVLTQPSPDGGAASLETKTLMDPWGRQLVYEPQNLNPSTHKPHVYSNGPSPGMPPAGSATGDRDGSRSDFHPSVAPVLRTDSPASGRFLVLRMRPGFTLFELVLVLAIIVMLAGLAYPSLDSLYADFKLTQAADQVRACWSRSRAQAVDEGRSYRFAVVPNKGNYRAAPDGSDFWSGSGNAPSSNDPNDQPLVIDEALPKGIRFNTPDKYSGNGQDPGGDSSSPPGSVDSGAWTNIVTFLPDGTASDDVDMILQLRGARPLLVRLRGMTGAVLVKPYRPEDQR